MKLPKKVWIALAVALLIVVVLVIIVSMSRGNDTMTGAPGQSGRSGTAMVDENPEEGNNPAKGGLLDQLKNKIGGTGNGKDTVKETPKSLGLTGAIRQSGEQIEFGSGYSGYYTAPALKRQYGGVIVLHDRYGLDDQTKALADALASHGYNVIAPDLLNGVVTESPEEARSLEGSLNRGAAIEIMKAAYDYLVQQGSADIGAVGYGMGGGQAIRLAAESPLKATVIYYGEPLLDTLQLSKIKGAVYLIYGSLDEEYPAEKVVQYGGALLSTAVDNNIDLITGARHGFADTGNSNFSADASKKSWKDMLSFLSTKLR